MKFITEYDLRTLYNQKPLEKYELKENEKLTPGARQFLVDKGLIIYEKKEKNFCNNSNNSIDSLNSVGKTETGKCLIKNNKLHNKIKLLQSEVLCIIDLINKKNINVANELLKAYKELGLILEFAENNKSDLKKTLINSVNNQSVDEITDLHLIANNSEYILRLNNLHWKIIELSDEILGYCPTETEVAKILENKLISLAWYVSSLISKFLGENDDK